MNRLSLVRPSGFGFRQRTSSLLLTAKEGSEPGPGPSGEQMDAGKPTSGAVPLLRGPSPVHPGWEMAY